LSAGPVAADLWTADPVRTSARRSAARTDRTGLDLRLATGHGLGAASSDLRFFRSLGRAHDHVACQRAGGEAPSSAPAASYQQLLEWASQLGVIDRVRIEGTRPYGAGLFRSLRAAARDHGDRGRTARPKLRRQRD
jgi:hypothetical protein